MAPVVNVASTGLSPPTSDVLHISDIMQFFDHFKSSSILQLIKSKSRNLQKLLKYFNGTSTSASIIVLSAGVLPINFALCSNFTCYCFVVIYLIINNIIFISSIIHFIPITIPKTSRCYRIIATIF